MPKLVISLLLIHFINFAFGQNQIKEFVEQTTVSIPTIDPDSTNFSDLEVIGNAIGDSRIVMLGEQDHGDAPTFLAKTRLIKYLHEKKGFNVLVFEDDFFALTKGWKQLPKTKERMVDFLRNNIYFLWTNCEACNNLFYTYIPSTYNSAIPLQIAGIDNQLVMKYSLDHFGGALESLLHSTELKRKMNNINSQKIVSIADSFLIAKRNGKSLTKEKIDFLRSNLKELDSLLSVAEVHEDFWKKAVENLLSYTNLTYENRDKQMAENLKWLATKAFPAQKIIVWAANAHIIKYTTKMSEQIGSKLGQKSPNQIFRNMATDLVNNKILEKQTYILGFTSATGQAGRLGSKIFKVPDPKRSSFESWIPDSVRYGFVDFLPFNKSHPNYQKDFQLKGFTHMYYPEKFVWNRAFDGIFYIKEMYPCKR